MKGSSIRHICVDNGVSIYMQYDDICNIVTQEYGVIENETLWVVLFDYFHKCLVHARSDIKVFFF